MDLPDVNVLVAAHREDHPDHPALRPWLEGRLAGRGAFGVSELSLSSFLRIVTNTRIFPDPTPMEAALAFVEVVVGQPNVTLIRPGAAHFGIFLDLCRMPGMRANLVPDAYFAALAIESGCRWATRDRDFARFDGLDWFDPMSS